MTHPLAGQRLGPYEIIREIGRGGIRAPCYLAARADDQFQKRVALKVLRGAFNAEEILRRFRHERQILATLNHPNITTLLDAGSMPTGEPYFVMDYVDGEPLDRYSASHHVTIADRLKLFRGVCSAVHSVHQSLIVHRDLKPSNILVTSDGVPHLLDFGIAKILKPELLMTAVNVTGPDALMMTPAYASPEQVRGEPITTASDIYSLGVILYELLTGRSPYQLKGDSPTELWRAIADTVPERSRACAASGPAERRQLKGDLDNILLKAIRKEPHRQYPRSSNSPRTYAAPRKPAGARPSRFLRLSRREICPASQGRGNRRRSRRNRADYRRRDHRGPGQNRRAPIRGREAVGNHVPLRRHDSIQSLAGSTAARALIAKTGTEYLDRLSRESQGDSSLQKEVADGYIRVGDVEGNPYQANLGNRANAIRNYRKALAIGAQLLSSDSRDVQARRTLAHAHLRLAGVLAFDGKPKEGLEHSGEAIRLYQDLVKEDAANAEAKLDLARAWDRQGDVLAGAQSANLGRREDSAKAYEQALALLPAHSLTAGAARVKIAVITKLADLDRSSRALDRYREALQMADELVRNNPGNHQFRDLLSAVLNRIAGAQQDVGDTKGAMENWRRASEIDEASLKADPNNRKAIDNTIVTPTEPRQSVFRNSQEHARGAEVFPARRGAARVRSAEQRHGPATLLRGPYLHSQHSTRVEKPRGGSPLFETRSRGRQGFGRPARCLARPPVQLRLARRHRRSGEPPGPRGSASVRAAGRRLRGGADVYSLHVLAQAYAGTGDYRRAIESEERALALYPPNSPPSTTKATMETALAQFRAALKKGTK